MTSSPPTRVGTPPTGCATSRVASHASLSMSSACSASHAYPRPWLQAVARSSSSAPHGGRSAPSPPAAAAAAGEDAGPAAGGGGAGGGGAARFGRGAGGGGARFALVTNPPNSTPCFLSHAIFALSAVAGEGGAGGAGGGGACCAAMARASAPAGCGGSVQVGEGTVSGLCATPTRLAANGASTARILALLSATSCRASHASLT